MAYHLADHIYITQFKDELILLDTKLDKYTICFKSVSDSLLKIISGKLPLVEDSNVQNLIKDKIIVEKDTQYPFYIDFKPNSDGVSNIDWKLPLNNKKVQFKFNVIMALLTLIKINFYIKTKGFYSAVQLIKTYHTKRLNYIIPTDDQLRNLADTVNKACLIYPSRTKCLEWAMTFVLIALKRGWKCNLEIGVQNYPFMAHAWVECNGKVVMDSAELREGLAIILNEPFRKLKK